MSGQIPRRIIIRLARGQRGASVNAEAIVWRALRDRRCGDLKFRRQVPIGQYIADFVCFEKRLIVELSTVHLTRVKVRSCMMLPAMIGSGARVFGSCA